MYKIYCKDTKEFVELQSLLLSQGYAWVDSGKKIIHKNENLKNIIVSLDRKNKILRYTIPGLKGIMSYDVSYISWGKYMKEYENHKMANFVNDIFKGEI